MNPLAIVTIAMEKHEEIQRWAEDWNRFEALRDPEQYDQKSLMTRITEKLQGMFRPRAKAPEPCV